jgi:diketogulonate reductase-like aldo/keto reductase
VTGARSIELPSGDRTPVLGVATWGYAEDPRCREEEIATLREALNLGLGVIDTAELYAGGAAEQLIGEAIAGRRDDVFLVDKAMPGHATREGLITACKGSLHRLGTDRIDLYLLHWRGSVPLRESVDGFRALQRAGAIRHWGVANFDVDDLAELRIAGGHEVQTDLVLYNLAHRGIEYDLLPWCLERGLPVMTYFPLEGGRILDDPTLEDIAGRQRATPAQVALAWVLRHERLAALARASTPEHVRENLAALDVRLTAPDITALDRAFPRPVAPHPLDVH